jgi:hypothetical protein
MWFTCVCFTARFLHSSQKHQKFYLYHIVTSSQPGVHRLEASQSNFETRMSLDVCEDLEGGTLGLLSANEALRLLLSLWASWVPRCCPTSRPLDFPCMSLEKWTFLSKQEDRRMSIAWSSVASLSRWSFLPRKVQLRRGPLILLRLPVSQDLQLMTGYCVEGVFGGPDGTSSCYLSSVVSASFWIFFLRWFFFYEPNQSGETWNARSVEMRIFSGCFDSCSFHLHDWIERTIMTSAFVHTWVLLVLDYGVVCWFREKLWRQYLSALHRQWGSFGFDRVPCTNCTYFGTVLMVLSLVIGTVPVVRQVPRGRSLRGPQPRWQEMTHEGVHRINQESVKERLLWLRVTENDLWPITKDIKDLWLSDWIWKGWWTNHPLLKTQEICTFVYPWMLDSRLIHVRFTIGTQDQEASEQETYEGLTKEVMMWQWSIHGCYQALKDWVCIRE